MTFALVPGIEVLGQPEIPRAGVDEVLVQRAKDIWRSSKGEPGKGDEMFFSLALSLRRAGMEFYEIESALHSEASYGRTPKERLSQIPSIMSSLRRYSRSAEFNEAEKEELERLSDLQELLHDAQCERVILQKAGEETALHETVIDKIREEMKATQGKTDDQNSL